MISRETLKLIEEKDNQRYTGRLEKLGSSIKTLGWDNKENQWKRFASLVEILDLSSQSIVDIGCGFGDFLTFLQEKKIKFSSYIGIDINEDLLKVARAKHPGFRFTCRNVLLNPPKKKLADIGFAFGILNLNHKGSPDNYEYAQDFIKKIFDLCKKVLVVDMLSANLDKSYPKEDFVFYYEPQKMLDFSFTLTKNVVLKHDYPPIPQKEFALYLKK
ncbi:MAG: class I SAM-dependent methyltransferase [Candidatus Pacebacteria bacterium]|nr:class I SAM-dependent methyltransferase [Candidatus Paceibacterota bacterium]